MTDQNEVPLIDEAGSDASQEQTSNEEAPHKALPRPDTALPSASPSGISIRLDSRVIGGLLIGIGALMFLGSIFNVPFARFLWPLIFFILPGLVLFFIALKAEGGLGEFLAILASIVTMLGLLFLVQSLTGAWASWAYAWSLIAPTSVGLGQIIYGMVKRQDYTIKTGMTLARIGIIIFLVGFVFFEVIIGISGFGFGHLALPILLILLGLYLLFRNLIGSQRNKRV